MVGNHYLRSLQALLLLVGLLAAGGAFNLGVARAHGLLFAEWITLAL